MSRRKKRQRQREYSKNKISPKYTELNIKYKLKLKQAKKKFKRKVIDNIKESDKSQWCSKLKWISNYDNEKKESITVEEIDHLSDELQAEAIADSLAAISNEYNKLTKEDINFSHIPEGSYPQLSKGEIQRYIENIKPKKSTVQGDIPAILLKECAQYICVPIRDIINQSISNGKWANIYKKEIITPIPKTFPPESVDQLRPIANLLNINKIQERAIADMLIEDMQDHLDPSHCNASELNQGNTTVSRFQTNL